MTRDVSQPPAVSVVICAHNSRRDYLAKTLEALAIQSLAKSEWELTIVDNASTEPVESWDRLQTFGLSPRVVREEKLGLVHARLTGIQSAQGALLVFVDDDNVLSPDYLERALEIAASNSHLGCFGSGTTVPEYDSVPSADLEPYLPALALRKVKRVMLSNNYDRTCAPYGAGLVVTRAVADNYVSAVTTDPTRLSLDRVGTSLNGCGDIDLAFTACDSGKACGVFPELKVTHLIPGQRIAKKYLQGLLVGAGQGSIFMLAARHKVTPSLRSLLSRVLWLMIHSCRRTNHNRCMRYLTLGEVKGLWMLWRRTRT